ncbi:MAG: sugar transferase [Prochlorococcaceae cyanobacterium]
MGLFWILVSSQLQQVDRSPSRELEIIVVGLCTALVLSLGKIYESYRQGSLFTVLRRLTTSWLLVLATLLTMACAAKITAFYSRTGVISWAVLTYAILVVLHVGGRQLVRKSHVHSDCSQRYVYWGLPDAAVQFHQRLKQCPYLSLQMVAWFSPLPVGADTSLPDDMPRCGGILPDLRRWLTANDGGQIIFSYVARDGLSMQDLIRFIGDSCILVIYAPSWVIPGMSFQVYNLCGQPCIDLWRPLDSAVDRHTKRVFETVVSGVALLMLSSALLGIAFAIRLPSEGPILFKQDRYGLD